MSLVKRLVSSVLTSRGPVNAPLTVVDLLDSSQRRVRPVLPPPTAADKMRIHLFAGHFASQNAAWHYCFFTNGDRPEELVRHLPDAPIDTTHVEVLHHAAGARLSESLSPDAVQAILDDMDDANTLVIISEPAFGGLAYSLNDTPRLRYLGPLVVAI